MGTPDSNCEETCPQGVTGDSGLGRKPHSELGGEGLARLETRERGSPRWVTRPHWSGLGRCWGAGPPQSRAGQWAAGRLWIRCGGDGTWGPSGRKVWTRNSGQAQEQRVQVRRPSRASSFWRAGSQSEVPGARAASPGSTGHADFRASQERRGGGRRGTGPRTGARGGTGDGVDTGRSPYVLSWASAVGDVWEGDRGRGFLPTAPQGLRSGRRAQAPPTPLPWRA